MDNLSQDRNCYGERITWQNGGGGCWHGRVVVDGTSPKMVSCRRSLEGSERKSGQGARRLSGGNVIQALRTATHVKLEGSQNSKKADVECYKWWEENRPWGVRSFRNHHARHEPVRRVWHVLWQPYHHPPQTSRTSPPPDRRWTTEGAKVRAAR